MGKRSRKRPSGPVSTVEPAGPARPRAPTQRRPGQSRVDRFIERADERPKPPWHPVPLVELSVLVGIVLILGGLTFLPSLALGPIADHLAMIRGQLF